MAETKYTEERARIILDAIEEGASDKAAAGLVGIDADTYYRWLKRGAQGEEPFAAFSALAHEAKAKRQLHRVRIINDAAHKDWHAASWLLERSGDAAWHPPTVTQKISQDVNQSGRILVRIEYGDGDGTSDIDPDAPAPPEPEGGGEAGEAL
jgi:hypothetical protein